MATINTDDFKSNSFASREAEKKQQAPEKKEEHIVKPVVQGNTVQKKKTLGRRFVNIFLSEDVGDVKTYILYDVIVPAIKENIADIINSAVGMLFFGEARRRGSGGSRNNNSGGTKINYGGYFNGGNSNNTQRDRMPNYSRSNNVPSRLDDIIFESRGDAEQVLDGMEMILEQYGQVTVSDFYDLCGISSPNFTDNKYGWKDLRSVRVTRAGRDGFMLDLPREIVL